MGRSDSRAQRAGIIPRLSSQNFIRLRRFPAPLGRKINQFPQMDEVLRRHNRAPPPKAWRWEIYRAGNVNPIKQSSVYFDTTAAARRAGKEAFKDLLNKLFA